MRRLALLACLTLLVLVPAARADEATGGGTVAGVVFQDANSNGAGPEPGESGLPGWIVFADLDGNGLRAETEPSATAGADGRYTLGPLAPGDYTLRLRRPDRDECPADVVCTRQVTVADGVAATADFAVPGERDPGRILVDDGAVRVGTVKLSVPGGCPRRAFIATLRGQGVKRVDFRVDGRLVRSVRRVDERGRYTVRIDPARVRAGRHVLSAAVWFSRVATKPAKTVRATFRSCAVRQR
jgi:hypothetical protein